MKSGLARLRNAASGGPPVPLGGGMATSLPGMGSYAGSDLALMRAYKTNGTARSNIWLLASATASQQWHLYRPQPVDGRRRYTTADKGSDQRKEVIAHAALNLVNNPAPITVDGITIAAWTRQLLMELSGIWMETVGRSTWVVDWGGNIPIGLWPVRPDRVIPVPSKDRYLAGWVYRSPDGQELIPLRPVDVIYNRYPDPEDVFGGCGPLASVLTDIQSSRAAAEWNRNYFENSAEPGGVIQVDGNLSDPEFDQLVDRWRETHRGVARAHRIAVLEGGQTWVPNHVGQRDMEFTEGRAASRDIIREALAMHKVMTGVTDDVNRASAQTGEQIFDSWQVAPRLDRWRDNVFNPQILPLFGVTGKDVEWDYTYPMAVDREADALELTAKANAVLARVTAGYDQHDVLEMVGFPDMDVALQLSTAPALPPRWTSPPPAPAAVPAPSEGQEDTQNRTQALLRQRAGWGSEAWDGLPWKPFRLDDQRFAQVNGHSLVRMS